MARTYPDEATNRLIALATLYLRAPSEAYLDTVTGPQLVFVPDLTAGEQATLADLTTMAKFGITSNISLAEFTAIKPDLVTARAFVAIASPTAAQSNAALKSTIRILGALLRA